MIAPLLTFALQAATYQAGMPTHNYINKQKADYEQTLDKVYHSAVGALNKLSQKYSLGTDILILA